jgi:uncharacterized protein (TIGR03435 family)
MLLFGVTNLPCIAGQVPDAQPKSATFEVASIHRSRPDVRRSFTISPGGRFGATGTTLKGLILFAYNIGPDRLSGATGWMESEQYDVMAEPTEGAITGPVGRQAQWTGPNGQSASWTTLSQQDPNGRIFRLMLRDLLADRFQLKLRNATQELPVYALVVAKGGSKLRPSSGGNGLQMTSGGMGEIHFQGTPMSTLAATLTWMVDRPVLDRTGLTGIYDLSLNWTPDEGQIQVYRQAGSASASSADARDVSGPSLFTALQEQLGLRLESAKGPVDILVVDRAEKPSEN